MSTVLIMCDTKTCVNNENGQCKEKEISIAQGKCTDIKSITKFKKDGSWRR